MQHAALQWTRYAVDISGVWLIYKVWKFRSMRKEGRKGHLTRLRFNKGRFERRRFRDPLC